MEWQGYRPIQIAVLLSAGPISRVFAPYFWGMISDKFKKNKLIFSALSLTAFFLFSLFVFTPSFKGMLALLILFQLVLSGILPLVEAQTFLALESKTYHYGRVRLWGSVGFIATVSTAGFLFDKFGISLFYLFILILLFVLVWAVGVLPVSSRGSQQKPLEPISNILKKRGVILMLLSFFLMQVSQGPLNGFFSIFLLENGYNKYEIGLFWALSVFAEVILFFFLSFMFRAFSFKVILAGSCFFAFLRFILIAFFPHSILLLFFGQLLHAFTFGAFHAASIAAINRVFTDSSAVRGQALYTSVSYGAGGGLGVLVAGVGWDPLGGKVVFWIASLLALITSLLILIIPRVLDKRLGEF